MNRRFEPLPLQCREDGPPELAVCFDRDGAWVTATEPDGRPRLPGGHLLTMPVTAYWLIGRIGAVECGAIELADGVEPGPGLSKMELRHLLEHLPPAERTALGRARHLLAWRRSRRFCGKCGAELADAATECARVCAACGALFFTEIAPAIIVAVRRGDRLLLAHNRKFRAGLYSLVAGFVEPGETLEEAVVREVREEVGVEIGDVRYFGSQSWPFPNSLMLGFTAEYAGGDIRPDGAEITAAEFFAPDEFPEIPAPGSISRKLIDDFLNSVS